MHLQGASALACGCRQHQLPRGKIFLATIKDGRRNSQRIDYQSTSSTLGVNMEFAPKTILSLIDLSQATANVLQWTRLFAEKFGSEVQILHAMWPPVQRAVTQEEGEHLLEEFEERRVELRRAIRDQADEVFRKQIPCEVGIGVGHPVKVVLDGIAQSRPDLIILGSHGHDGMARSLMGSVAENVVRESAFPTLVVKGPDLSAGQQTLNRQLCPVDLTQSAAEFLDTSANLARAFGATLDVLRVLPRRFLEFSVLGRTTERVVRHGPCSVLLLRLEPRSN